MTYLRTLALLVALLIPTALQAQLACGPREEIVRGLGLDSTYKEEQIGLGLSGNALVELWASREPPYTWTILVIQPNGWTCLLAVGTDGYWKDNDPLPPPTY